MFSNFIVAVEAIIPIFGLMAVGLIIRKMRLLTDIELVHLNKMVFTIFFFVMMFYNTYTTNIGQLFRPELIGFAVCGLAIVYILAFALVCFFEKDNRRRGAMIQGIYRSNFVLMGIPMAANICGDDNIAVTTMMIAITVPLYNILSVFTLETFRGGKFNLWHIIVGVLKNPMIIGAILGAFMLIAGIPLPKPLMRPLQQITAAATPMALIILGASFKLNTISKALKQLVTCIIARLIIIPGIVLTAAMMYGFRGVEFVTLISIFATPCAVAGYAMAQQMDSDADLAGNCVVFTSAFSAITLFGWIFIFKTLGMF